LFCFSFIEDFFQLKGVTLSEEDKRAYNHDLYMNNLPEKDVYINLLKAAGFSDIQVGLTKSFYLSNSEFTQPNVKGKKTANVDPDLTFV